MKLPLENIRVLDATRALSGPLATMILADLGADVIKVEMPGVGDETRHWGPPFAGDAGPTFLGFNRSKRSIALDLHSKKGRETCLSLASDCEVFVENFRPGTAARLGIDYAAVRKVRPDVIYCSISGYGQTGPMAGRPAMDLMVQAVSGLMSLTGEPDGRQVKAAAPVSDVAAGLSATIAILGALMVNRETGEGRHIDVAMLDATFALMGQAVAFWGMSDRSPTRVGNAHPLMAPYESFRTADGEIVIAVTNQKTWSAFCQLPQCGDLAHDPRFAEPSGRSQNRAALVAEVQRIMLTRTSREWLADLDPLGIPAEPINNLADALNQPQVALRQSLVEIEYPEGSGNLVKISGMPWRDVSAPGTIRNPPALDQHHEEILAEFRARRGMDGDQRTAGAGASAARAAPPRSRRSTAG